MVMFNGHNLYLKGRRLEVCIYNCGSGVKAYLYLDTINLVPCPYVHMGQPFEISTYEFRLVNLM
jgi:hypothetical protein